jgi:hypothetical protein
MSRKSLTVAAVVPLLAAALLATACSSSPSGPSWCPSLITALHAKQTRQAELAALVSIEKQGAPVGRLIADESAYAKNQATAASASADSFTAVADAPGLLAKVAGDLKALNAQCRQPADAYKSDNA